MAYSAARPALLSPASGQVGVYVGAMYHEYLDVMAASGQKLPPQAFVGNGAPYMVGRLSYRGGGPPPPGGRAVVVVMSIGSNAKVRSTKLRCFC